MGQGEAWWLEPMVGRGCQRWLVGSRGVENCPVAQPCSAEGKHSMTIFWPSWGLLRRIQWLPMVVEVLGVVQAVGEWWQLAEKWTENAGQGQQKKSHSRAPALGADRGEGFGSIVRYLFDLIKIKNGPKFIVDIASFQLDEKSSNLVIFWLSKNALKLH